MQVDYKNYKDKDFTCKHCGWQGKGSELSNGDFSEMHFIGDLDCPKCFELVAFWQAPLIDNKDQKAIIIKRKVAAFSDFLEHGIEKVKKHFPDEVGFVLENKDNSYPDVIGMLDKELEDL